MTALLQPSSIGLRLPRTALESAAFSSACVQGAAAKARIVLIRRGVNSFITTFSRLNLGQLVSNREPFPGELQRCQRALKRISMREACGPAAERSRHNQPRELCSCASDLRSWTLTFNF